MKTILFTLSAACTLATSHVLAETTESQSLSIIIGGGAISETAIYKGAKDEVMPLPLFELSYGRWIADIDKGIGYKLIQGDRYWLTAAVGPRFAPDFPGGDLFSGLERDTAVEAALHMGFDAGPIAITGAFRHDVSSVHDGFEAEVKLAHMLQLGILSIETAVSARFLDEALGAHLYGVTASEASETRVAYAPGGSWSPKAELTVMMPVAESLMIGATARHEFLSSEITNSPLVDADGQSQLGLFLLKAF